MQEFSPEQMSDPEALQELVDTVAFAGDGEHVIPVRTYRPESSEDTTFVAITRRFVMPEDNAEGPVVGVSPEESVFVLMQQVDGPVAGHLIRDLGKKKGMSIESYTFDTSTVIPSIIGAERDTSKTDMAIRLASMTWVKVIQYPPIAYEGGQAWDQASRLSQEQLDEMSLPARLIDAVQAHRLGPVA